MVVELALKPQLELEISLLNIQSHEISSTKVVVNSIDSIVFLKKEYVTFFIRSWDSNCPQQWGNCYILWNLSLNLKLKLLIEHTNIECDSGTPL